jgi:hypothetical protein
MHGVIMWSMKKNNSLADGIINGHKNQHHSWAFPAHHLRFEEFPVFEM